MFRHAILLFLVDFVSSYMFLYKNYTVSNLNNGIPKFYESRVKESNLFVVSNYRTKIMFATGAAYVTTHFMRTIDSGLVRKPIIYPHDDCFEAYDSPIACPSFVKCIGSTRVKVKDVYICYGFNEVSNSDFLLRSSLVVDSVERGKPNYRVPFKGFNYYAYDGRYVLLNDNLLSALVDYKIPFNFTKLSKNIIKYSILSLERFDNLLGGNQMLVMSSSEKFKYICDDILYKQYYIYHDINVFPASAPCGICIENVCVDPIIYRKDMCPTYLECMGTYDYFSDYRDGYIYVHNVNSTLDSLLAVSLKMLERDGKGLTKLMDTVSKQYIETFGKKWPSLLKVWFDLDKESRRNLLRDVFKITDKYVKQYLESENKSSLMMSSDFSKLHDLLKFINNTIAHYDRKQLELLQGFSEDYKNMTYDFHALYRYLYSNMSQQMLQHFSDLFLPANESHYSESVHSRSKRSLFGNILSDSLGFLINPFVEALKSLFLTVWNILSPLLLVLFKAILLLFMEIFLDVYLLLVKLVNILLPQLEILVDIVENIILLLVQIFVDLITSMDSRFYILESMVVLALLVLYSRSLLFTIIVYVFILIMVGFKRGYPSLLVYIIHSSWQEKFYDFSNHSSVNHSSAVDYSYVE